MIPATGYAVRVILDTLRAFWAAHGLASARTLVAVSGGADSTALVTAMAELGEVPLVAAHVNHHLRGAESDADHDFVRDLCARLGVPCLAADGPLDPAAVREQGVEAAARSVRFARLQAMRESSDARYIATAHQKNDQGETVLLRLARGGGLAAMRGIRPVRADGIIRPLLEVTRADIEAFLAERGITPRSDSSNANPRFLRNRIRRLGPRAIEAFASVADDAHRVWPFIESAVDLVDDSEAAATETAFRTLPESLWLRQALLHRHIHRLDPGARDVSARDLERLAGQLDGLRRVSVTKRLELASRNGTVVLYRRIDCKRVG
jgi:tRNA(Ile)-lysidine synthetase-like protein